MNTVNAVQNEDKLSQTPTPSPRHDDMYRGTGGHYEILYIYVLYDH